MPTDDLYSKLFEQNRRWVKERTAEDPEFFEKLSREQHPEVLFVGCSDSRVPANTIMGLEPGQVFVHRNVANLVVNTDVNFATVLHYAVEHLAVKHVVVCGHYGCGGVKAALHPQDMGIVNSWLREIRDVYRLHKEELNAISDEEERLRRLVELNVQEQAFNVIKTAVVQRYYLQHNYPRVHGWVYDLSTGLLKDLELPFEHLLEQTLEVYRLHETK